MVKPELRADGSVKINPDSLVRSSLLLSGIGARRNKNGAALRVLCVSVLDTCSMPRQQPGWNNRHAKQR